MQAVFSTLGEKKGDALAKTGEIQVVLSQFFFCSKPNTAFPFSLRVNTQRLRCHFGECHVLPVVTFKRLLCNRVPTDVRFRFPLLTLPFTYKKGENFPLLKIRLRLYFFFLD